MAIRNPRLHGYAFLQDMVVSDYFRAPRVDKGKQILRQLCERIEATAPASEVELYALTHAATDQFNALADAFYEHGSEIETVARDCIASDFGFIAQAYGFAQADPEELVATRDG